MKKLFTICIAIIFAAQLSAQRRGDNESNQRIKEIRKEIEKRKDFRSLFFKRIGRIADRRIHKSAFTEKLDSIISETFDGSVWFKDSYQNFTIDANGKVIEEYYYYWNENNNTYQGSKDSFSYDNNNNLTKTTSFYFLNDIWNLSYKTEFEYNGDGKVTKTNSSFWNGGTMSWEVSQKEEYEYDANKNEIKFTTYFWNVNVWENDYKQEYDYNGNNKLIKSTSFNWNTTDKDWENSYKSESTYNSDGNISETISQTWDMDNDIWINDSKEVYNYDANKNMNIAFFENWDLGNGSWEEGIKIEVNYDLNVAFNDILYPSDNFGDLNVVNKILGINAFERVNNNWVLNQKQSFYYSPFTTSGINKDNLITTTVYPNPASDVVNFDVSNIPSATSILIFDINGKQVANYDVNGNNTSINISQLTSGFYMYKILGNDFISSGKLVKE